MIQFPKAVEDALCGNNPSASRRNFLKGSGALIVSMGAFTTAFTATAGAQAIGPYLSVVKTFGTVEGII